MTKWIDQRIESILSRPQMWGRPEAVELQFYQLLEVRAKIVDINCEAEKIVSDVISKTIDKSFGPRNVYFFSLLEEKDLKRDELAVLHAEHLREVLEEYKKQFPKTYKA